MYGIKHYTIFFCVLCLSGVAWGQQQMIYVTQSLITVECQDCELNGSLMMPETDSVNTVVLFISGAADTDRDCNQGMMRTNAFRMLASELASYNFASVRYDKRGVGSSRQQPIAPEDLRIDHFISDAKEWIKMLKRDRRFSKVIVLGHSEGSLVALAACADNKYVDGVISISGVGRTMDQVLKDQFTGQPHQVREVAIDIINSMQRGQTVDQVPVYLTHILTPAKQPFLISTMHYNPQVEARRLKCPYMVVQGENDIELRIEDAKLLSAAHGKAKLVTIPGMNHVMKDCTTNDPGMQLMTYANPTLPLNRQLVLELAKFIKTIK